MTIIVTKQERDEFFAEYEYEEQDDSSQYDQVNEYENHLQKFRKYFYSIPRKELKCDKQDMFKDRVGKQRVLIQKFCNNCNYEFDCAYLAVLSQEEHGVWGGLETKKIKAMVKSLRKEGVYNDFSNKKNEEIINLIKTKKMID